MSNKLTCPRCGEPNRCECETSATECWCDKHPEVILPNEVTGTYGGVCLCERCLEEYRNTSLELYLVSVGSWEPEQ